MIKVVAPTVALRVLDRAIQAHGGGGVCQDMFLAAAWATVRTLRLADGPDEVHRKRSPSSSCVSMSRGMSPGHPDYTPEPRV